MARLVPDALKFIYVKTFPKNIYHLDNNIKDKQKILEENEKPKKPKVNLDSCIEFQPNALDYFTEKDIYEIKQKINLENEEQPLAIHEQYIEKGTDSNNDINVILENYIEQSHHITRNRLENTIHDTRYSSPHTGHSRRNSQNN